MRKSSSHNITAGGGDDFHAQKAIILPRFFFIVNVLLKEQWIILPYTRSVSLRWLCALPGSVSHLIRRSSMYRVPQGTDTQFICRKIDPSGVTRGQVGKGSVFHAWLVLPQGGEDADHSVHMFAENHENKRKKKRSMRSLLML